MEYKPEELEQLHKEIIIILKEILRVCNLLHIDYFIIAGTAIGSFYNKGFVPWDDDLDLGMTRDNYNRFLMEAPHVLGQGFFLQCFNTEPDTPFYFAKVRKDHTLFVEKPYKHLKIHHGIFVDIFPFDNVPDNPFMERVHRRLVQFCDGAFKRSLLIDAYRERYASLPSIVAEPLSRVQFSIIRLIPRKFFYWRLCKVQTLFNGEKTKYVSIVKMPLDQIDTNDVLSPVAVEFEGLSVLAPSNLERYLRHHYPHLAPLPPAEFRVTHAPEILSFNV